MLSTKKRKSLFFGLLSVAIILFIFYNSLQSGEESSRASGFVTGIVKGFLNFLGLEPSGESLSFIVRKTAHFGEYFLLSLAISSFLLNAARKKGFSCLSVLVSFCVAACDEFIMQGATDGRSPQWTDVLIDTSGALTALLLLAAVLFVRSRKEKSK